MIFFCSSLTLGGKLEFCGRDDLFFALHLTWKTGGFKLRPPPFKFLGTLLHSSESFTKYDQFCTHIFDLCLLKA